jgi:nicotinamide-nucleotide amidase
MKVEILTVGSELLSPDRVDTNSEVLIEQLASIGIQVSYRATAGDDRAFLVELARQAFARSDLIIVTGGLGPTSDDVTRESFAEATGLSLQLDESVLAAIRRRFTRRGYEMPEVNRRQAMVPAGAEVLSNPVGTAPGLWIRSASSETRQPEAVLLPGPPAEMISILNKHVMPRLRERGSEHIYRTRRLLVAGLPESVVEERIGPIYHPIDNPRTGLLASGGQIEIRLTAAGRNGDQAEERLEKLVSPMREALGTNLFSDSGEAMEQIVGRLLTSAAKTLSVAESCTGGLITHRLTEVPGASTYLERSFITYSNRSKTALLGVPEDLIEREGAVSESVARAMSRGARERAETDLALAVTGIAGPSGGSAEKPVGLVFIAVGDERGEDVGKFQFPGGRSRVKQWTAQTALNLLRLKLLS